MDHGSKTVIYSFSCLEKIIVVFGERSDLQLGARVSLSLSSCPSTFFFCCSRVNKGDSSVTRVIFSKKKWSWREGY